MMNAELLTQELRKGVFRRGVLQKCPPLLAVALLVPIVLLGPISLVFCASFGVTLDPAESPFATTPLFSVSD